MKKPFPQKETFANNNSIKCALFIVLLISGIFNSYSQVRVPFSPRASDLTPARTIYNVKGDFTMIGNTNLTLVSYSDTANNYGDMQYVDVDGDPNTLNSSSSTLTFSNENGAIQSCSNIIYAGLYWTGRAEIENTFSVTKGGVTKNFDKQKVLIKGPSEGTYTEFEADLNDIYFPAGTDGNMYSAYTEITEYVQDKGLGEYFVADIATLEGDGGTIGYYGGWGMVVVYENSKMKWRDVTVFDGNAYVPGSTITNYDIDISGFNAVQNGAVNIKLGLMTGEGDVSVPGDYFQIQRHADNVFESLSHSGTIATNFFNSSILTGGNPRNPNLLNNTGVDIAMFNIDNGNNNADPLDDNKFIGNNQTSTKFKYGSTKDTYVIFNLTFSVDAYVPVSEGVLNITSVNGNPPNPPDTLEPGQSSEYTLFIRNTGTEATNDTKIIIPIPETVDPNNFNISFNIYPPFSAATVPYFDAGSRSIVWELGTLPLPADPNTVLADLSFTLTVTKICDILSDPDLGAEVTLGGSITGIGATSNAPFNFALIQGYETTGLCKEEPIPTPIRVKIDSLSYISEPPTASNPEPIIGVECIEDVPEPDISVVTDEADNSGIDPIIKFVGQDSDGNTCPEVITRTYSVTDDCDISINVTQTITINDVTEPTFTAPEDIEIFTDATCSYDTAVTFTGDVTNEADNCSTGLQASFSDSAPVAGLCEGTYIINRTWSLKDNCDNLAADQIQKITISDKIVPTFTAPEDIEIFTDATCSYDTAVTFTGDVTNEADNCSTGLQASFSDSAPVAGLCEGTYIINRTWSLKDNCDNLAADQIQKITISDKIVPTFTAPEDIEIFTDATCSYDTAVTFTGDVTNEADNCSTGLQASFSDSAPVAGLCEGTYIINRTWSLVDSCGNSAANQTQTITVSDKTAPTFTAPEKITINCEDDAMDLTLTGDVMDEADNCSTRIEAIHNDTIKIGDCPNERTIVRTWSLVDSCNNAAEDQVQIITVKDTKAPVTTTTYDETLTVSCADIPEIPSLVFIDNCTTINSDNIVFTETNSFDENILTNYEIVRTWTVNDDCGNEAPFTQTLAVSLDEIVTQITAQDRCFDDGSVDLNDFLGTTNTNGVWELTEGDPVATLTDNVFDPSGLGLNEDFIPNEGEINYIFKYTTFQDGCIIIYEVSMNINADCKVLPCGENDVIISKAVTPNGDFYNESFDIEGIESCGFVAEVKIFNRWGALIYESNSYQTGKDMGNWKGTTHSSSIGSAGKVPNGTYYYIVKLKNSGLNPFTGPVYLGTE